MTTTTSSCCPRCGIDVQPAMVRCMRCGETLDIRRINEPATGVDSGSPRSQDSDADFELGPSSDLQSLLDQAESIDDDSSGADRGSKIPTSAPVDAERDAGSATADRAHNHGAPVENPTDAEALLIREQKAREHLRAAVSKAVKRAKKAADSGKLLFDEAGQAKPGKRLRKKRLAQLEQTLESAVGGEPNAALTQQCLKAVDELVACGHPEAVALLLSYWHSLPLAVEAHITQQIALLHSGDAFIATLEMLLRGNDVLRRAAVQALPVYKHGLAVEPLLAVALGWTSYRSVALAAIGKLDGVAVPYLSRAAREEPSLDLRVLCVEAIGRVGSSGELKLLAELLEDESPRLRSAVVEAVGRIGTERSAALIAQGLRDDDIDVRKEALVAAAQVKDRRYAAPLAKCLAEGDDAIRLRAVELLGEIGDRRAVRPLTALAARLTLQQVGLRTATATALGRLGDVRALETLLDSLRDSLRAEDDDTTETIVAALRRLKDRRAIPDLSNLLSHGEPKVRQRAVEALGAIGDRQAAPRLSQVLRNDSAEEVRGAAAKALADVGDVTALPSLEAALSDMFAVRSKAVLALATLADHTSLQLLVSLLSDSDHRIRYNALNGIGAIGDKAALGAVYRHVTDSNEMVQRAALKAAHQLGDDRSDEQIIKKARRRTKGDGSGRLAGNLRLPALRAPSLSMPDARSFDLQALVPRSVGPAAGVVALLLAGAVGGWYFLSSSAGTGEIILRGDVTSVSISADGSRLLTGRSRGLVEIWDIAAGEVVEQIPGAGTIALAGPQPGIMVIGGASGLVYKNGEQETPLGAGKLAYQLLSADRKFLLTVAMDETVTLWNLSSGKQVGETKPNAKSTSAYNLSRDGRQALMGNSEGRAARYDFQTDEFVTVYSGAPAGISAVADGGDGTTLVAGCEDGSIVRWTDAAARPAILSQNPGRVTRVVLIGETVIATRNDRIEIWEPGAESPTKIKDLDTIGSWSLSPDLSQLAVGSDEDTEVILYDLPSGKKSAVLDREAVL